MLAEGFPETLVRACSGDENAFTLIFRDVQPALLRYSHVHAPGHGDDISAEVWLEVARALPRFTGDEQGFRAWVFTIARNKITDQRRRDSRRPTTPFWDTEEVDQLEARDVADDYEDDEATRRALALVRMLPPRQAEVILLRVVAGLDTARIARLLDKTPGAIRVLLHRGLRRLSGIMTEQMATGVSR